MRISVIVKAGHRIGLGHLTRGHTFAKSAARRGHSIQFISITDSSQFTFKNETNITYINEYEFEHTYEYLSAFTPDLVVLDLLDIDSKDAEFISRLNTINVCLSPKFNHKEIVHFHFSRAYLSEWPSHTKLYVGLEYLIIPENIFSIDNKLYYTYLYKDPLPISICMGGADPENLTLQTLKAVAHIDNIHPHIFVGPAYNYSIENIKAFSNTFSSLSLHFLQGRIWSCMNSIPLSIISGGQMAFESAYAGIPSINILRSQDYNILLHDLESTDACIISDINNLRDVVMYLKQNIDSIKHMRNNCLSLNIHNGAHNCLKILEYETCYK